MVTKTKAADLMTAVENLGRGISGSPIAEKYRLCRKNFMNDEEAKNLYSNFMVQQREFQISQQYNPESEIEHQKIVQLQNELLTNKIFKEYIQAQNSFIDHLKEINQSISSNLVFDFASYAKPASRGCCG